MTDELDRAARFAHWYKQAKLEKASHALVALRGGGPVALIVSPEVEELLGVADVVAAGYGADGLALVIEGVVPTVDVNPMTGQPWAGGEAEDIWLRHDGAAQGWVSELQLVSYVGRDGVRALLGRRFALFEGVVQWDRRPTEVSGVGVEGHLAAAFSRPIADPAKVQDPGDRLVAEPDAPLLPITEGRRWLDIGVTRTIDRQIEGGGATFIVPTEVEANRLHGEGLATGQSLVYTDAGR